MTEVPEHLLRRSKERRAAIGGGGSEGGEPPATPGEAPGAGATVSAVEPAAGTEVAAAAPAPVEEPPKPLPPHVEAALRRPRVPRFAIPVLAALPVWALVYAGTLFTPTSTLDPELEQGKAIYAASCSGCHGSAGEGGTGRPLGEVLLTFPNKADHIAWVENGSPPDAGTPYGDPNRPGGPRIAGSGGYTTKMPGFKDTLSPEEIDAVTRYEREELGGGEAEPAGADSAEGGASTSTTANAGH